MAIQWKYKVSPVGWIDMPKEQKWEINALLKAHKIEYKHRNTKEEAQKDAKKLTMMLGIAFEPVQFFSPSWAPF